MQKLLSLQKKFILPALIFFVSLILCVTNYTPGNFLSGWDTLQPEFNFPIYLQRIFWGVWQQHQGLGAVAAQAHASELGRLWYLILGGIFLPLDLFRWGYFWICLLLGPLGMFFLLRKNVRPEAAFLGALFYLLNLGTVQYFYLPLEMFATAYAFLPWLFWAVRSRRTVWLAVLFFLAAPMAHTPTLFFASFAGLVLFALCLGWRWGVKVLIIGLLVNSFWLLPSLYFIFNHGSDVTRSHISQQFSSRAILTNKEFATIPDLALIKGYLFDWGHYDFAKGNYAELLTSWKNHLKNPLVLTIGYGIFAMVIAGLLMGIKKKNRTALAFLPVFGLAAVAILDFIPLPAGILSESLRFPFTKFSILLMISFSFYFAMAMHYVFSRIKFEKILLVFVSGALVFYMLPAFIGNLICPCVRVQFPQEYQQAFDFFKIQNPNTRIAQFPVDSIFGWKYYSWGYEGAGFQWFGLPQPILDREFDRWTPTNENYYFEISYALYSKNLTLFENVLEKYRINWLLLDENIVNPQSPKALFNDELKELIARSDKFVQLAKFREISIYGVNLTRPTKDFVSIATELPGIGPEYKWGNLDRAFVDFGDYVSTKKLSGESLIDSGGSGSSSEICLSSKRMLAFLDRFVNGSGCGPDGNRTRGTLLDKQIPDQPRPTPQDSIAEVYYPFRTLFTGKRQEDLEFDPAKIDTGEKRVFNVSRKCDDDSGKTTECVTIYLPDLVHAQGYVVSVESINYEGLPLAFWVENLNSRKSDLETYLPKRQRTSYFVLPPMEQDGLGYSIHFDSVSVGKERAVNEVGKVTVAPFDYQGMVTQKVGEVGDLRGVGYLSVSNFSVSHPNPSWYQVDLKQPGENLILAQSFENGWVAWDQDWHFLKHKKINNWANGWELLLSSKTVYIFFWPQTLEFIGFGILGSFILVLLFLRVQEK